MTAVLSRMCALNDLAGKEVGRYRIVALLGAGGMGEVYDAIDSSLGRHVALKILRRDAVSDANRVARFVQEARSAAMLNHPNLVSIHEIGEDDGVHFIAMEKIDGSTLREILTRGRFQPAHALDLMAQVTDAVATAHAAGIIHRDLKPENIMVSSTGHAKVLDFGLAKLQAPTILAGDASASTLLKATDSGSILGTAGYMSPEQAQGQAVDARTDVFSLGCILYETITGRRAFQAASSIDTLHKLIHEDPPPLRTIVPDVSAEIERIVRKSISKDPDERYQSVRDMTIDLRNARKEFGTSPGGPRTARPLLLAAMAIAGIVAVIFGTLAILRRAAPNSPVQVERITRTGDVVNATISPDGKYMAYVRYNETGQSLWLRQLSTDQDLNLIPAGPFNVWGVSFTPDSNTILYSTKSSGEPDGILSSIPVIGGRGQRLLQGIDSGVSFSPDGKQIAYLRRDFPQPQSSALMIASSDGSGSRAIAVRHAPDFFSPIWFSGPSWSPDGKLIATASIRRERTARARIVGINPITGAEQVIADPGWQHVGRVTWLPDGKNLVAIAGSGSMVGGLAGDRDSALWLIPIGGGEPRPITRDVDGYRSPTVTDDGSRLMCVRLTEPISELWLVPMAAGSAPQKLLAGLDIRPQPSYLANGNIAFSTRGVIASVEPAAERAAHATELVHDRFRNSFPIGTDRGIVYTSSRPEGETICEVSLSGESQKIIAPGRALSVTRDGSRMALLRQGSLWIRSLPGGHESKLPLRIDIDTDDVALSPSGDRIAVAHGSSARARLEIYSTSTNKLLWSTPVNGEWHGVHWMPDGSALLASGLAPDRANVWKFNFHGEPTKVTNFYGQLLLNFDISPDGRNLTVVRTQFERDAVIIRGFD